MSSRLTPKPRVALLTTAAASTVLALSTAGCPGLAQPPMHPVDAPLPTDGGPFDAYTPPPMPPPIDAGEIGPDGPMPFPGDVAPMPADAPLVPMVDVGEAPVDSGVLAPMPPPMTDPDPDSGVIAPMPPPPTPAPKP